MSKKKMPLEMRWRLAQARAKRIYDNSPNAGLSFGPRKIGIADDNIWACDKGVHVFGFGAYGSTYVLAYGCLEDALEDAAAWLADNAPGHLTKPDYADPTILLDPTIEGEMDADKRQELICERAEADLTYTESGWLLSHEWTVTEMHSPEDLLTFVRNEG